MLQGNLQYPTTFELLRSGLVWQEALDWIRQNGANAPEGEHEIRGRDMYANIHSASLLPRNKGVFEAHKNYIDLHFCLEGAEIIEWAPVATLKPRTKYDAQKDYALFDVPTRASSCLMVPGSFAIFFPGEGHMPKVSDGEHVQTRKVVIKIKRTLATH